MQKTVYNLGKCSRQMKPGAKIYPGCTFDSGRDTFNVAIATYDTKGAALAALCRDYPLSCVVEYPSNRLVNVEEYYVEEIIVNEDGDFLEGGAGILEFSKMPEASN